MALSWFCQQTRLFDDIHKFLTRFLADRDSTGDGTKDDPNFRCSKSAIVAASWSRSSSDSDRLSATEIAITLALSKAESRCSLTS